jgi:hypothetical protein
MDGEDPDPSVDPRTLFYGLWPRVQGDDEEAEEAPATD